jgi:hypothetical protein
VKNSSKGRGNVRIRQDYPEPNLMSTTRNCSGIELATKRDVLYQKLMFFTVTGGTMVAVWEEMKGTSPT